MVGSCPVLPPPPLAVVDALSGAKNSDVDAWAIALSNHYRKLALCAKAT